MRVIPAESLIPYIHNALDTEMCSDGTLAFSRFTQSQQARYRYDSARLSQNDLFTITYASANVTLEMETDSHVFGMDFRWKDRVNHGFASFDLMVDGRLWGHLYTDKEKCRLLAFKLLGDGKTHHVQLFMPWSAEVRVRSITLSDGAYGDSITQGYLGTHPAMNYIGCVTRELNAECLNQAIGGYYFEEASLDDRLANWQPDLVTIAYGTNDYALRPTLADIVSHAEAFCRRLTEIFPGIPILGIMPIYRDDERHHMRELMRDWSFRDELEALGHVYAQFDQVTVLEDTWYPRHADFLAPDQVHPNDMGFLLYGQRVTEAVRNLRLCSKS